MFTEKKFIANKIKTYRKYAGMTQSELAEKVGISDKHICRIENGVFMPSLETFLKIITVLKINLEEFGINIDKTEKIVSDKLLKLLYTASDDELLFYFNIINELKNNMALIKKK